MSGNAWLVSRDVAKTVEIKAPNGETATVDLRKMNEGDRMDRENALLESRAKKGAKDQSVSYKIGLLREFDLQTSIVAWSLPFPISRSTLRDLDPSVASQIHDAIRDLNPFIFADDDDDDAEAGAESSSPTEPDASAI